MNVSIQEDSKKLGFEAGKKAALLIQEAIKTNGCANIILATGSSQFETLSQLINETNIEWDKVTMFHLDEYIDVALVGIGENGHLAFNDPPADFDTEKPYIIVDLNRACRQQQVNEDWFESFEEVPKQAISMSVKPV